MKSQRPDEARDVRRGWVKLVEAAQSFTTEGETSSCFMVKLSATTGPGTRATPLVQVLEGFLKALLPSRCLPRSGLYLSVGNVAVGPGPLLRGSSESPALFPVSLFIPLTPQ